MRQLIFLDSGHVKKKALKILVIITEAHVPGKYCKKWYIPHETQATVTLHPATLRKSKAPGF